MINKYKETNLFNENSFKLKVFKVVHAQYSILRLHWHDYIEFIYFSEGEAIINIGSLSYEVEPGDILLICNGESHCGYSIDGGNVKFYPIVFDRSILTDGLLNTNYRSFIMPFVKGSIKFPTKLERSNSSYRKVKGILKSIIYEYQLALPGFEIKIKAYLDSLIIDLFRGYLPIQNINCTQAESSHEVKNINHLISHIYLTGNTKITLSEAAQYVNLSQFYFCKVFKKTTNKTFVEFLNSYKIAKAEEMLLYTTDSILNIAQDVGFCNTNYFHKVFKKFKGLSPSEYRKSVVNSSRYELNSSIDL